MQQGMNSTIQLTIVTSLVHLMIVVEQFGEE